MVSAILPELETKCSFNAYHIFTVYIPQYIYVIKLSKTNQIN